MYLLWHGIRKEHGQDYYKTTFATRSAAHYRLCEKDTALPSRALATSNGHCELHSKAAVKTPTKSAIGPQKRAQHLVIWRI